MKLNKYVMRPESRTLAALPHDSTSTSNIREFQRHPRELESTSLTYSYASRWSSMTWAIGIGWNLPRTHRGREQSGVAGGKTTQRRIRPWVSRVLAIAGSFSPHNLTSSSLRVLLVISVTTVVSLHKTMATQRGLGNWTNDICPGGRLSIPGH